MNKLLRLSVILTMVGVSLISGPVFSGPTFPQISPISPSAFGGGGLGGLLTAINNQNTGYARGQMQAQELKALQLQNQLKEQEIEFQRQQMQIQQIALQQQSERIQQVQQQLKGTYDQAEQIKTQLQTNQQLLISSIDELKDYGEDLRQVKFDLAKAKKELHAHKSSKENKAKVARLTKNLKIIQEKMGSEYNAYSQLNSGREDLLKQLEETRISYNQELSLLNYLIYSNPTEVNQYNNDNGGTSP